MRAAARAVAAGPAPGGLFFVPTRRALACWLVLAADWRGPSHQGASRPGGLHASACVRKSSPAPLASAGSAAVCAPIHAHAPMPPSRLKPRLPALPRSRGKQGWDQGILGAEGIPSMKPGGKRRLVIPPELAYGGLDRHPVGAAAAAAAAALLGAPPAKPQGLLAAGRARGAAGTPPTPASCSPGCAAGDRGAGGVIPPKATLASLGPLWVATPLGRCTGGLRQDMPGWHFCQPASCHPTPKRRHGWFACMLHTICLPFHHLCRCLMWSTWGSRAGGESESGSCLDLLRTASRPGDDAIFPPHPPCDPPSIQFTMYRTVKGIDGR